MLLFQLNLGGTSAPTKWPIAPAWLLRAAPRVLKLTVSSMPFVGDFSAVDPTERVPLSIDFSAQIPSGDGLASVASSSLDAYYGTDANAASLLYGSAAKAGTVVTQWAGPGWLPGVVYRLTLTCLTTNGATVSLYAHIACNSVN